MLERDVSVRGPKFADHEMVELVRATGADSPEFRALKGALEDYVVGTLTNLDRRGELFKEIKRQCGITLLPPPAGWRDDSRRLFVLAAIVATSTFMRRHVLEGGWSPHGGSSLRTYCMRAGLYTFVDEYKVYHLEERPLSTGGAHDGPWEGDGVALAAAAADPARVAVARDTVRHALRRAGPDVAAMLLLTSAGWTQQEIGRHLDLSAEAVSSALRRFRRTVSEYSRSS